jgi:hypothetical protein
MGITNEFLASRKCWKLFGGDKQRKKRAKEKENSSRLDKIGSAGSLSRLSRFFALESA